MPCYIGIQAQKGIQHMIWAIPVDETDARGQDAGKSARGAATIYIHTYYCALIGADK